MKYLTIASTLCLLQLINHCAAYCFYNNLIEGAGTYALRQQGLNTGGNYFSRFVRHVLKPGESACCPYDAKDCNKNGNPDESLEMLVTRRTSTNIDLQPFVLTFPAGGSVYFTGGINPSEEKVDVYNADGTRFARTRIDHNV